MSIKRKENDKTLGKNASMTNQINQYFIIQELGNVKFPWYL